jgi:hypothetical protein
LDYFGGKQDSEIFKTIKEFQTHAVYSDHVPFPKEEECGETYREISFDEDLVSQLEAHIKQHSESSDSEEELYNQYYVKIKIPHKDSPGWRRERKDEILLSAFRLLKASKAPVLVIHGSNPNFRRTKIETPYDRDIEGLLDDYQKKRSLSSSPNGRPMYVKRTRGNQK